jgi:hypothetical protein
MSQNFELSYDQRLLLDLYIDFYNHTTRQMDSLRELQNEIRGNINQIVGLNQPRNNSTSTQNSNTPRHSFRQNSHIQSHNSRISQEQRRRRNNAETTTNRRYMYYGSIPYLVPSTDLQGRPPRETEQDNTFFSNLLRTFYDHIQVAPTRQQIEAATRIVNFSEIENPLNNSCPVTLDRFENNSIVTQIIPCGHIFSSNGIDSWLQTNVRCPVCRYDIRDYNSNAPTTNAPTTNEPNVEEETKEEDTLEEPTQERNSNSNPLNNANRTTFTSSDIQNTLSTITENILGQILNPPANSATNSSRRNLIFDTSFNSIAYDASNNQFIFEGYLR